MNSTDAHIQPVLRLPRVALGVVSAVVVALIVNTGVAFGTEALEQGTRTGLLPVAYGPLTILGVIAGTVGWAAVRRYAARPGAVLRVLVPVVVALSLVPGIVLFAIGTDPVNVIGLWVMHLVVTVVTITVAIRVLPLADESL